MIVPTSCQNLVKIGPAVSEISRAQKRYVRTYGRTYVRTDGRTDVRYEAGTVHPVRVILI